MKMNALRVYWIFAILFKSIQSGNSQSFMIVQELGTNFIPANPIELIANYSDILTFESCYYQCYFNFKCRTIVSDTTWPFVCRLYEGSINTGTIIPSSSSTSRVSSFLSNVIDYSNYNQTCHGNSSRYLICSNGFWRCPDATYWNGSLCLNTHYYNQACNTNDQCRSDVGLLCDSFSHKCMCNSTMIWNSTSCISSSSSTAASMTDSLTTVSLASGGLNGITTRYWDCCKVSCGWDGKALVTNPVQTCAKDGITPVGVSTTSVCDGGTAFTCNNQQPWGVNSSFAYGFAAVHIVNQNESMWCCACYSIVFTSGPVIGQQMIVQATNTGADLGLNQFDLQIPGGGMGYFSGCLSQYNGSYSWGQQYGGVSNRSDCANLPASIQNGCYWRFDWFKNADNPNITFIEVPCPVNLTSKTNCTRY